MKKTIIIILVIIAVFIGILASIPLFFKQTILDTTKKTINSHLNAEVDFDGFKLSLFNDFPRVTLELQNVLVTGKGTFQSDTLVWVSSVKAKMNLKDLIRKSGRSIEEIYLDSPKINLLVAKSGEVNWDLAVPSSTSETVGTAKPQDAGSTFNLKLNKVEIKNADLYYTDEDLNMLLGFENINFDLNGDMYGTATELNADGKVERFSLEYGGVKYISNTSLETKTLLNVDYESMDIAIKENELLFNRLPLQITGDIKIPSDSMYFNLAIKTKESGFENFLALVPPDFEDYLKKFQTSGTAEISGNVSGLYYEDNYPAFNLALKVSNGNFHYADLPEEIKNIRADVSVTKPQGVLNLTEIKVKEAHAELKNNPVDLTLTLNNLVADPFFDGAFVGKINFNHLKDALPLDSVNISGTIDANLFVKGNYSSIEKEQYDKIQSDGIVLLDNFVYESVDLTQPVFVNAGKLDFSPQNINLSQFNMRVGQSDFNLYGKVSNYLNYIFKDGILKGDLQLNSNYVNLNELLRLQVKKEETLIRLQLLLLSYTI